MWLSYSYKETRDLSPDTPAELSCWSESPDRQLLPCCLRSMTQHPKCSNSCCPLLCDSTNIIFRFWSNCNLRQKLSEEMLL